MINNNVDENENYNITESSINISDYESSEEEEEEFSINPKIDKKFKNDEKYKINFINTTLKNPKFSLFNSSSNHKAKYLSNNNNIKIEDTTIKSSNTKIINKGFKSKIIIRPFNLYKSIYYFINFTTNNINNLNNTTNNIIQFKLYKDSDIFNFSSYLNKNIIINKTDYDTDTDSETLDKANILIEKDIKKIFIYKYYKAKNITFNIKKINK